MAGGVMGGVVEWCETMGIPLSVCETPDTDSDGHGYHNRFHKTMLMVESLDGSGRLLGLLAADKCGCHGDGSCADPEGLWAVGLRPACDGSGRNLRARTEARNASAVLTAGLMGEPPLPLSQERVALLPVAGNRP